MTSYSPGPHGHVSQPSLSVSWQYVGQTMFFRHCCWWPMWSVPSFMNIEGSPFLPPPPFIDIAPCRNPPPPLPMALMEPEYGVSNSEFPWLKGFTNGGGSCPESWPESYKNKQFKQNNKIIFMLLNWTPLYIYSTVLCVFYRKCFINWMLMVIKHKGKSMNTRTTKKPLRLWLKD